jgi:hypothetical protein
MMRAVGLLLLVLAVGLAAVGGYFLWGARDVVVPLATSLPSSSNVTDHLLSLRDSVVSLRQEKRQQPTTDSPSPPPHIATAKPAEPKSSAEAAREKIAAGKAEKAPQATIAERRREVGLHNDRPSGGSAREADVPRGSGTHLGGSAGPSNEQSKIEEHRKALEQLPKGDIVLNGPSAMKVGETRTVYANVGVKVPIEKLRESIRPGDQKVEGVLAVSSEMVAMLNGSGFKITGRTPEQQSVAEGFPAVWGWDVEAKETGDQELEATLYAVVGSARQRIASYTHKISVSVKPQTWGEWVKSFQDEIDVVKGLVATLSAAVTAVMGWLVLYIDRRRRKGSGATPSEAT